MSAQRSFTIRIAPLITALGAALALVPAAPAAAKRALPPLQLEQPPAASGEPEIAMDARGNALAAWVHADDAANTTTLLAATRPPGGPWSQAETIAGPTGPSETFQEPGIREVRVALSRRGDATVAWSQPADPGRRVIEAATRPAFGAWTIHQLASIADSPVTSRLLLAGSPRGHAVAMWTLDECGPTGCRTRSQSSSREPGGQWSAPETLVDSELQVEPSVAVDRRGRALAVWTEGTHVESATRPRGGPWSASLRVAEIGRWSRTRVQLAMNARGDAVALWHGFNTNDDDIGTAILATSARPARGAWGSPEVLGTIIGIHFEGLALDRRGNALAIGQYQGPTGTGLPVLNALTRPAGGRWSAPEPLLRLTEMGGMSSDLALDPAGEAVLGVAVNRQRLLPGDQCCAHNATMQVLRRSTDGRWSAPQLLETRDEWLFDPAPLAAISRTGEAVLLWPERNAQTAALELHAAAGRGRR